jgi:hypothetical protein
MHSFQEQHKWHDENTISYRNIKRIGMMRPFYDPEYIINQSLGSSFSGPALPLKFMWGYCMQAVWTGATAAGTLKLQASNDSVNWSDITGSSTVVSGPGSYIWNAGDAWYPYVQLVFVQSSGTGNLNATVYGKGT